MTERIMDKSGLVYGRLIVMRRADGNGRARWMCLCSCGTEVEVSGQDLTTGHTKSCGCLRKEITSARLKKHGMTGGPEWSAFQNAKNRCNRLTDVRFAQYGGRGIQFRFASFEEFLSTIGPRPSPHHSLDRIDADGHYEPGNVRWADSKTQARNKTGSRLVTIDGVTKPLKEWCEERGQPYKRVWERMRKGMPPTEALAMPALRAGRPARGLLT